VTKSARFLAFSALLAAGLTVLAWTLPPQASGDRTGGARHAGASPAAVTLTAISDTYVNQLAPGTSHGNETILRVSRSEFGEESFALIRFDLSAIPAGAVFQRADLQLYLRNATDCQPEINVYRVTEAWSSASATWNSRPATSAYVYATHVVGTQTGGREVWAIPLLVDRWVNQPASFPNHGLAVRNPGTFDCFKNFDSIQGAFDPYLVLEYTVPTATVTPTPKPSKTPTATNTPKSTVTLTQVIRPTKTPTTAPTLTHTPSPTVTITHTPTPRRAAIGGRVWNDADRDGRLDAGEPPMQAARLRLELDNVFILETTIDAQGAYQFANLEPERVYRVHVDEGTLRPGGLALTTSGNPLIVVPHAGQSITTAHFGYALPPSPVVERLDTWIMGIEVNQGLQDALFVDLDNPGNRRGFADPEWAKGLILDKPAVVRVYVGLRDTPGMPATPADGFAVGGELHVQGVAIGSPRHLVTPLVNPDCREHLSSDRQSCRDTVGVFPTLGRLGLNTNGDYDLDLIAARTHLEGTLNFLIEPELLAQLGDGGVIVTADVWPVRREEISSWDNAFELQLDNIAAPKPLEIDLVRVGGSNGDQNWDRPSHLAATRALSELLKLTPYDEVVIGQDRGYTTSFRRMQAYFLDHAVYHFSECESLWIRLFNRYGDWVSDGHTVYALIPPNISLGHCAGLGWKIPNSGGIGFAETPPYAEGFELMQGADDEEAVATMAEELYHAHRDRRHVSNDHGEDDGCSFQGWVLDLAGEGLGVDTDCWKPALHPHGAMGEYPPGAVNTGWGTIIGRIFGDRGAMGIHMEQPTGGEWRLTLYDACPTGAIDRADPIGWLEQRWDTTNDRYRCQVDDDDIPHDFMTYGDTEWTSEDEFQGVTYAPAAAAGAATPAAGLLVEGLRVTGVISMTGQVAFAPALPGRGTAPVSSPVTLTVQTRQGASFGVPALVSLAPSHPQEFFLFSALLPAGVQPSRVGISYRGQERGSFSASPHPPSVRVLWPNGGEALAVGKTHVIRWEAGDADGEALEFAVEFSPDGGASWRPLGSTGGETSLAVEAAPGMLDPGGRNLVRVTASDGLNVSSDRSDGVFAVGAIRTWLPDTPK
jgi:hypothetical protein